MTDRPVRIQRSRARGWRMPPDTVCVDRSTSWGNPFVVGRDGTTDECVQKYEHLMAGFVCVSEATPTIADQLAVRRYVAAHLGELRGKNLACWCRLDRRCHADVLLKLASIKGKEVTV
jgi:Domain of unknown function (DUF4326)